MAASNVLTFQGCNYLKQRLVLATLSGKPVRITNINPKSENPGILEYEINLIRLLDKITNGSRIEVNETGTSLYYQPGILIGGRLDHECNLKRPIGYYLEMLLPLAPFCKKPLQITLTGITNGYPHGPSVDRIIYGGLPVLRKFLLVDDGLVLKINKRGLGPEGGGEVFFSCPTRKQLRPVQNLDDGKIKRIRGIVYACRVSPTVTNRIVTKAKGILLKHLPDIYIYTDHRKGDKAGKSPGYGITLVAESTTGGFLVGEAVSEPSGSADITTPEEIGEKAAYNLIDEIYRGGCVDSTFQYLVTCFMVHCPRDISKYKTGPLSPYTFQSLRTIRDFYGIYFKLEVYKKTKEEEGLKLGANKIILTCLGIGYTNMSKKHT